MEKKKLDACRHLNTNRCKKWLQKRVKLPAAGVTRARDSKDNDSQATSNRERGILYVMLEGESLCLYGRLTRSY